MYLIDTACNRLNVSTDIKSLLTYLLTDSCIHKIGFIDRTEPILWT